MVANRKSDSTEVIAAIRDVTVTFDGYMTRSLARVSLGVRRGEVLGVLGAENAGKSTLLRIIAGRLRPTEGSVKVFGRSPRWGAARARIGYVPGKSDQERPRGFFSRLFRRKTESSQTGTRGVPGLTQAIIGARDLLVLDEPFAEAGPAEKIELKSLIRDLTTQGKTVILSGDSLADTKDICDRLLVLHEGRIQAMGSLQELLAASGALRFLAPVLPSELAGRIAEIVRRELAAGNVPIKSAPVSAKETVEKPASAPSADDHLTRLTKPIESTQSAERPLSQPQPSSAIDHEKLQELTKPARPE